MNLNKFIHNCLLEGLGDGDIWYHGTPDVRQLEKDGGFTHKTISLKYVEEPQKLIDLQSKMKNARESKNKDLYFQLLDQVGDLQKDFVMKKPIFLTNKHSVAKTYADPQRAFDYQGAKEKILKTKVISGKNIIIKTNGDRFRFINTDSVKDGFVNAGVSEQVFDNVLSMFNFYVSNKKGIKTETITGMAQYLNFDSIDVLGVLDSYHGGTIKSTVKVVFDHKNIKIIK